ncbi:MAG: septum formation initiator family protein [Muribaculaceae bacterium]|nr:septum formation initiator family protein [Muribaculaceae bacterium]MCF0214536.1 septum formation initiator family protein [Muribaculaceae bacterium]
MGYRFRTALDWCRRYFSLTLIIVIGAIAFVLFFNDNSAIQIIEYERQISDLKKEIKSNRDTLEYYQQLNERLNTDRATMEQIVREQYHMQRPGEDVYIFEK